MRAMKRADKFTTYSLLAVVVAGLSTTVFSAAKPAHEIDLTALLHDTQKQTNAQDRLTMVWWLTEQFWACSLSQEQSITEAGVEEFLAILRPYVLVAVVDGTLGPLGGATFVDPKTLRDTVAFVDDRGQKHKPLDNDGVSADARNFATMMKPVLSNMLGAMGENITFLFFPAVGSEGAPLASATNEGTFSVEVGDHRFTWKTPLGSVLLEKVCPVDNEELNGAWSYCPWHGKKLVAKVPAPTVK